MSPILGTLASQFSGKSFSSFESISTVTVGGGGAANIEFTSIPATYTHLQIRGIVKGSDTADDRTSIVVQYNSDTGNNYARHLLGGNGSGAFLDAVASSTARAGVRLISSYASYASMFTALVIDILDYANTNKYKTVRNLNGVDVNGLVGGVGGFISLVSGLWMQTNAITSLVFNPNSGTAFTQYSSFALYGIKAA